MQTPAPQTKLAPLHPDLSVTKALAAAGYHVRALTRSPASEASVQTLGNLPNVTPTYFDINDRKSAEAAFEGANYVYALTIPDFNAMAADPKEDVKVQGLNEEAQGNMLADVAKEKGVKIFVW